MSQQLAGPAMPLGPDRSEYFEALVTADASGEATPDERALLEASPERWQAALEHLLDDTEEELAKLRRLSGLERLQVVADFAVDGAAKGENLAARFEPKTAGVWELRLKTPITEFPGGKLIVTVRDRHGNETRIERSFSVK